MDINDITRNDVGSQLRKARDARQWSPTRLAAALDVSADTLSNYESGRSEPSFRQIVVAARLLDFPLEFFIGIEVAA